MTLEIDFETRSACDLKTHGVYRYMADATTAPLMASYKINGGALKRWRPPEPCPDDIVAHVTAGGMITAHSAAFERLLWQNVLTPRYGWPAARVEQFRCTAATAAALSLPRALGNLGEVLDLPVKKDKEGMRLIRKFSIPRKPKKGEGLYAECPACDGYGAVDGELEAHGPCQTCDGRGSVFVDHWHGDVLFNEPKDHPDDFERFHDYCDDDVLTEEAADRVMVPLSDDEQAVYVLGEIINDRGVRIDVKSARAAIVLAEKAKDALNREMRLVTRGAVPSCTQPGKLVEWLAAQGIPCGSADKNALETLLATDDLPATCRKAIEIRLESAKPSVSKLSKMLALAGADGRVRGAFMYHAASTGRFQSSGVNVNNLPRPRRVFDEAHPDPATLFKAFRSEDPEVLELFYGEELGRPLHLISDAIRGFIWAAPGHDLVQADYSGIEGAVTSWFCDEHWKVAAMHEIIANPELPDMYRRAAAGILNTTTDIITRKHPMRQAVGKTSELACFGAETLVLTKDGAKQIVDITENDWLWDGAEWVRSSGVISKGVRQVVDVDGIEVTPDHLILTGETWTPARELASSASTLCRALGTGSGSLPSSVFPWAQPEGLRASPCSARAKGQRTASTCMHCSAEHLPVARSALRKSLGKQESRTWVTTTLSQTRSTAEGYLTASPLALAGAPTRKIEATGTTAGAAFQFIGVATGAGFSNTSSRSTGGMFRNWNSTVSTSTGTTRPATFGSSPAKSTQVTDGKRARCKPRSLGSRRRTPSFAPVYDIANSGPRNRFTIFSNSGALIVHNCGFGGGVAAFYAMAMNYNVDLGALYDATWEAATAERKEKAVERYEKALRLESERTVELSREAWLACEIIKVGWREQNSATAATWKALEQGARDAIKEPGTVFPVKRVKFLAKNGFLWMRLPSGRALAYPSPRLRSQVWAARRGPDGSWLPTEVLPRDQAEKLALAGEARIEGDTTPSISTMGVDSVSKKFIRSHLYGGKVTENLAQGIARDLLINGMRKAEAAGYPIVMHVYDEMVAEVPRGFGDLKAFERMICELPEWARGVDGGMDLPLTAGGWRGKRYRKD